MAQIGNNSTIIPKDTIKIGDLHIQFPHVPYSCQQDFMEKVVEALNSNANAALESPTGTGKTLSLLCSAIAWVQRQKELVRPQPFAPTGLIKNNAASCGKTTGGGSCQPVNSDSSPSVLLYPKIFYASRTHSQLHQVVRELNKTTYKSVVRVATLAGRDQLCLNEKVLKETNSEVRGLLCRTLTRTHKCHYYNKLEKDAELVDLMYSDEANGSAMDIEDLMRTAKKFNHCPFYQSRHMSERADLILLPYVYLLDPKVRDMYEIKVKGNILIFDEAHNMEQIAEESVSVDFSTRTLSVAIEETKQVLEMVMEEEESIRKEMDEQGESFASLGMTKMKGKKGGKNANDEGGEEEAKNNLKKDDVALLLLMLQSFEEQIDAMDLEKSGANLANLQGRVFPGGKMFELMKAAEIHRHQREQIGLLIDRIQMFLAKNADKNAGIWAVRGTALSEFSTLVARVFVDTFEGFQMFGQDFQPWRNFQLFVETCGEKTAENEWKRSSSSKKRKEAAFDSDDDLEELIEKAAAKRSSYKELKLHYWCFDAGVAMRLLQSRGTRSILLASGTLAPLPIFLNSMGIQFGPILESAHCAREEQLAVGIIERGLNGAELLGTFQNRNELAYKEAIGGLIHQVSRVTPQGMLVFFPSYTQMASFIDFWKTPTAKHREPFWSILEREKRIFVEPRDKMDIPALFREFDLTVRTSSTGALLLAVCRGKLSEGIDFADSHCRAVLVVGIPFPPVFDPRVLLKKAHLCKQSQWKAKMAKAQGTPTRTIMNAEEWYKIEGTRAVNQALGRIIRHKDDFGAVILADSRYAQMSRQMLPSWMRRSVQVHAKTDELLASIRRFFAERGILVERSRQNDAKQGATLVRTKVTPDGQNDRKRGPAKMFGNEEEKRQRRQQEDEADNIQKTRQLLQLYAADVNRGIKQEAKMEMPTKFNTKMSPLVQARTSIAKTIIQNRASTSTALPTASSHLIDENHSPLTSASSSSFGGFPFSSSSNSNKMPVDDKKPTAAELAQILRPKKSTTIRLKRFKDDYFNERVE